MKKRGRYEMKYSPQESDEQVTYMDWLAIQYPSVFSLTFAVPNGSNKSWYMAAKFQAEGLKSGVPDICICYPASSFHGLFIEMKRQKGGKVSETQSQWIDKLNAAGYFAVVCKGFDEAKKATEIYLKDAE